MKKFRWLNVESGNGPILVIRGANQILTTAMKRLATISLVFIILIGSACKKEKDKPAKLDKIAGEYTVYRAEQLNPYLAVAYPTTEGKTGKFVITTPKSDSAIVTLFEYDKDNKEIYKDPWYCKVTQNPDGEIMISEKGYLAAFIRSGYRLEFVGYDNELISARKK
jgi:hypothetical protein